LETGPNQSPANFRLKLRRISRKKPKRTAEALNCRAFAFINQAFSSHYSVTAKYGIKPMPAVAALLIDYFINTPGRVGQSP
jgi:hypothetical protein